MGLPRRKTEAFRTRQILSRADSGASGDRARDLRPEYSIYVFHRPGARRDSAVVDWEKKRVTTNMLRAYKVAEKLSASGQYRKIEVKRKFYDTRDNRQRELTVRLYRDPAERPAQRGARIARGAALACGAAAFAAACLLIRFMY